MWMFLAGVLAAAAAAEPAAAQPAPAQPPAQTAEERRQLEEQIARELGQKPGETSPAPEAGSQPNAQSVPAGQSPPAGQGTQGGSALGRVLMLPDIAAIGRFGVVYYQRDVATESPRDLSIVGPADTVKPLLQEVELSLQAVVDPYARADIFLSFAPGSVDVEEAYLTT
ncbi:MAG TPA: hypothetical protein VEP68_08380, partial [Anaeromyxobacteraceae bacterium]|nr:hypothetical protein [Anaeromyxobacteraceae bacterium]